MAEAREEIRVLQAGAVEELSGNGAHDVQVLGQGLTCIEEDVGPRFKASIVLRSAVGF